MIQVYLFVKIKNNIFLIFLKIKFYQKSKCSIIAIKSYFLDIQELNSMKGC